MTNIELNSYKKRVNLSTDGILNSIQHLLMMSIQQKLSLGFQLIENVIAATFVNHKLIIIIIKCTLLKCHK